MQDETGAPAGATIPPASHGDTTARDRGVPIVMMELKAGERLSGCVTGGRVPEEYSPELVVVGESEAKKGRGGSDVGEETQVEDEDEAEYVEEVGNGSPADTGLEQ